MAKTPAHTRAVCDAIAAMGNKMTLHTADPGTTGSNLASTTPASANTTWPAAVDGAGADAGKAVSAGSKCNYSVPPSTTITHYGIWNGSTFLRGAALDTPITTGAAAVSVDVTPTTKYS
ncbi:hypothetical protein [Tsukamurella sp. 1534]|uniref:hypothetical protein n=1 Tax=Tsukamurella sp. 1534 TaxID=1151061 RepID=UPI0002DAEE3E|nr:hypothetical protein [Tsukamurella sp. 1534]